MKRWMVRKLTGDPLRSTKLNHERIAAVVAVAVVAVVTSVVVRATVVVAAAVVVTATAIFPILGVARGGNSGVNYRRFCLIPRK